MPLNRSCLALAALVLVSTHARAQTAPTKQQCADAYTQAQILRAKDRLVLAKKQVDICNDPACPQALRKDCTAWLVELQRSVPLLAVDVVDESGRAVSSAHVTVDGNTVAGGEMLTLDPGTHTIAADAPGMETASQTLDLAKGEKRHATLTLAARAPEKPVNVAATSRPFPVAPVVLASIGVAFIGGFIGFGLAGNAKRADLDASGCKPNCAQSDVDAIKTDYVIADVSLGVGLASLAVATVLFIVGQTGTPAKREAIRSLFLGARF
jgi:hypothetical protein